MADERNKSKKSDRRDTRDTERPHRRFGEAVVSARMNLHMRRPEVAEAAGISYPMLANIESGRRRASDDIIDRLAPVLDLRADRMREVRDALEVDSTRFPTGTGLGSYLAGLRDELVDLKIGDTLMELKTFDPDAAETSKWESWISNVLVKLQNAEAWVLAANPSEAGPASPRMQVTSAIIRDLGSLDDTDLVKVRGYVDGLREARDRAATAVSPATAVPLIRVPDEPFGPLYKWPVPEWIKVTPDLMSPRVDLQRRIRQYRREAESSGRWGGTFGRELTNLMQQALTEIGATDESWPDNDEIRMAAFVGVRLAPHLATGERGMLEPGVWLQLAGLQAFPKENAHRAATLNWVLRMSIVASLLWLDTDLQVDFLSSCIDLHAPDLLLIEDQS
ncbi:helix-turn-helix domain-containing protein [Mycobacterium sp. E2733]|uniref:helix-turn-helix domain-containing protein n=1 Tax=Mycobacterium sp. E2733 TaxID=1834138 RepID=UPI0018D2BB95|nr:helix-turn-helix transcriptional regulator [Mycobacterium sp. E2733]